MGYLSIKKIILSFLFVAALALSACVVQETKTSAISNNIENPSQPIHAIGLTDIQQVEEKIVQKAAQPRDLWQRLFALYQLPEIQNERVQAEINWYSKHPEYLRRVQKNAQPYLHFIVSEIEKRNIPGELALLPIVESAYRPFAYSHGSAAGLWQFIPSTGKYFGLKKNWWYDGRRDVYASTQAALGYLTRLSKRFDNDWLLAIAAYNAGGGGISSAMKHNRKLGKAEDYWSLKVRKETHHYVPKLLAIAHILANAERYNIELLAIDDTPYFTRIDIQKQIDLSRAAELADISIDELYQLNPAFNQWATDPAGPHYLLMPQQQAALFKERLAELPDSQRLKWHRHIIKQGETLGHIARKYRTTTQLISETNNISGHAIRAGKQLLIPTARYNNSLYSQSEPMRKAAKLNTKRKGTRSEYFVRSGDSLWSIAKHHKLKLRQLAAWNAMAPRDTLKIGQKLVMWNSSKHPIRDPLLSASKKNQTVHYTVRKGDSLYLVALRFKVSVNDLKRWNGLNKKYLQPGDRLKIVVDVTRS